MRFIYFMKKYFISGESLDKADTEHWKPYWMIFSWILNLLTDVFILTFICTAKARISSLPVKEKIVLWTHWCICKAYQRIKLDLIDLFLLSPIQDVALSAYLLPTNNFANQPTVRQYFNAHYHTHRSLPRCFNANHFPRLRNTFHLKASALTVADGRHPTNGLSTFFFGFHHLPSERETGGCLFRNLSVNILDKIG